MNSILRAMHLDLKLRKWTVGMRVLNPPDGSLSHGCRNSGGVIYDRQMRAGVVALLVKTNYDQI